MPILEIENLKYAYGKQPVLRGISIQLEQGKMYAILGPSGCGKTTLLSLLGGLDSPASGQILYQGEDIAKTGLANHRRSHVAFIFQGYNLLQDLDALDNVILPLIYRGTSIFEREELAMDALARVGMDGRAHHRPSQMSGGQQQRVAIARAIATHPPIIMADEPTGALDSKTGRHVLGILQQLYREGTTILLITHDDGIAATAPRVVRLSDGKIISDKHQEVDWL